MSAMSRTASAPAHTAQVTERGGNYGYVPSCTCGWQSRGFAARHAAIDVADEHVATAASVWGGWR